MLELITALLLIVFVGLAALAFRRRDHQRDYPAYHSLPFGC